MQTWIWLLEELRIERTRLVHAPVVRAQIVAAALMAVTATPAMTQTVVEKRLAALQPCGGLKVTQNVLGLPVTIGIDKLEGVALSRAEIAMEGDDVTLSFMGGLSCRTSDQAVIKGDASVDLTASAAVSLAELPAVLDAGEVARVVLRGDENARYGVLVAVMDVVRAAGVTDLALVTTLAPDTP